MIDKTVPTLADAVAGIADGSTVLVGGFATSGVPLALIDALLAAGRVRRIVCSFPRHKDS